jgi:dienelactone hydrolase
LHLLNVASYGYLAIAPGGIYNGPGKTEAPPRPEDTSIQNYAPTRPAQLGAAIDWALAENERSGSRYYGRIDPEQIAISGFSCGGVQALTIAADPRVKTVVIMNSGLFVDGETRMGAMVETKDRIKDLHTPTLYVLGGPTDIAYANGMDDYEKINHVPIAVANIDKGHGGTYWEPNGGAAAEVVIDWLHWQLRGNTDASRAFAGLSCGLCGDPAWEYESKGL